MKSPQTMLKKPEFVALMAMTIATVAFSIDAMLPSLPEIGAALTPTDLNRAQLVLTSFVFGMGLGTFVTGPLSDTFGRRRVLLGGYAIYIAASFLAMWAQSLEVLLAARMLQGLGASGPRVMALVVVRDQYSGRQMAQLMSFVMIVFTLVPAIAPFVGVQIISLVGWRGMFGAFVIFALFNAIWFALRQPETLVPENRRPFSIPKLWSGVQQVLSNHVVRVSILVQSLITAALFAMISSVQQVFDITYHEGESFPLWFCLIALVSGSAGFLNAALVIKLGMRFLIRVTLGVQVILSGAMVILFWFGLIPEAAQFLTFLLWMTTVFFMIGMTLGNLNAIAMEPMGHLAGLAASVVGAISTVLAVVIAAPIGLAFDGTAQPLMLGVFCCVLLAWLGMQFIRREA